MNLNGILSRVKNTFKDINAKPKLVFLHVPKCGGTSIDTAIRCQYFTLNKLNDDVVHDRLDSLRSAYIGSVKHNLNFTKGDPKNNRNMEFNQDFVAYRMLDPKIRYISGHFPFDKKIYDEFESEYDFFTILRDPVEKWISNYHYRGKRSSLVKGNQVKHWEIEKDIEEYLNSERGQFHGYDYTKYYGGIEANYDYTSRESIEKAKENLKNFKIIGFLEDLDGFKAEFKNNYGFKLNIKHRNSSRNFENKLPDHLIDKIKEVCKTDIEIYEYAKTLMKKTL